MSDSEMREFDAWIANLMEPMPAPVPLKEVRRGSDAEYNCAYQRSVGGWWVCATGSDAEVRGLGEETMCRWRPVFAIASEPDEEQSKAAAMEVLRKCCEKSRFSIEVYFIAEEKRWTVQSWHPENPTQLVNAFAETLETCICLFARELFSK